MPDFTRRKWLLTTLGSMAGLAMPACAPPAEEDAEFDICIVGSGPAGAILAADLAERGIKTLLLEGGPIRTSRNTTSTDEESNHISRVAPIRYPVDATRFLGAGGTSNLWGGECPRFQPIDFTVRNPYLPADAPWPLSYEDLESYYQRAERALSIGGGESTRYSPPRREGFPFPPAADSFPSCLLEMLGAHGWAAEAGPRSRTPRVAETHVPRVSASANGTFRPDARVVSMVTGPGGRIIGLATQGPDGRSQTVRARFYVLACGGIETARLLLLSRTKEFPTGVGNSADQVGRYFMEHLAVDVGTLKVPDSLRCASRGYEEAISWQAYDEFKSLGLGGTILEFGLSHEDSTLHISAIIEMKPAATNRVVLSASEVDGLGQPSAEVTLTISDAERRTWDHVLRVGTRIASDLGARLQEADGRFAWCHHHSGTCRMGRNPSTSIVDPDLKVHGTTNLYASGSAVFVTESVGSPTLLLTALSLRLADHLASQIGVRRGAVERRSRIMPA